MTVHGLKIAAALVLLAPGLAPFYAYALIATLLLHNIGIYRSMVGGDGSDQMLTIVTVGLAVYYIFPNSLTGMMGVYFIVAQSLLAYGAAGVSKLVSGTRRSGTALRLILGTMTYGSESFSRMLDRYPRLDAVGSWRLLPLSVRSRSASYCRCRSCSFFSDSESLSTSHAHLQWASIASCGN